MPDATQTPTFPIRTPAIFAHRGASAHAPENTLAAFQLAIKYGADALEFDVKLSADGHVVVIHDASVNRTTNGIGLVGRLNLADLRTLDAGSHYDTAFQSERIPTLADVFETAGRKIFLNIELTNYTVLQDALPEIVAAEVIKHKLADWIMVSSFNPIALQRFRRVLPQVPAGLLTLRGVPGLFTRRWQQHFLSYEALHPEFHDVTPALISRQHRLGKRVHTYTVNAAPDLERLFSMGIDGVFTDDPRLARQILDNQRRTDQFPSASHPTAREA